jgi:hypothetical protein
MLGMDKKGKGSLRDSGRFPYALSSNMSPMFGRLCATTLATATLGVDAIPLNQYLCLVVPTLL